MARSPSLPVLSIAAVILASGIAEPCFGQPAISATLFLTPLGILFPNDYVPANLIPPATGTSTITLQSTNNFSATLNFNVSCCQDYLTGATVTAPEGVAFSFDPASVTLQAGQTATTNLHVTTSGQPSFGKFIATVQPAIVGGSTPMPTVAIPFTVLPVNETVPPCPLFTGASPPLDVLALGAAPGSNSSALQVVINNHNPPGPDTEANIYVGFPLFQKAYNVSTAVLWTINTSGQSLAAGTSNIVVQNQSKTDIGFAAYSSATCLTAYEKGTQAVVGPGGQAEIFFTKAEATTLMLSKAVMVSGFPQWHTAGAFSEPAFWTAFSGRHMTFVWQGD